jgi:hypothetical protein
MVSSTTVFQIIISEEFSLNISEFPVKKISNHEAGRRDMLIQD